MAGVLLVLIFLNIAFSLGTLVFATRHGMGWMTWAWPVFHLVLAWACWFAFVAVDQANP